MDLKFRAGIPDLGLPKRPGQLIDSQRGELSPDIKQLRGTLFTRDDGHSRCPTLNTPHEMPPGPPLRA